MITVFLFFRVQRKVVSLCVYRDGDWLHFERSRERFDSINTIVIHRATNMSAPLTIGDLKVQANFRYPVHSSKYYK